jgi:hypothetical protein
MSLIDVWEFTGQHHWQYPVITEQQVCNSLKYWNQSGIEGFPTDRRFVYLAVPWATIIDKNIYQKVNLSTRVSSLIMEIKQRQKQVEGRECCYFTACQHIHFTRIIPILAQLDVKVLFASHKTTTLTFLSGIAICPLQLFAVNLEDPKRNALFRKVDLLEVPRAYLYSFIGFYSNNYLTDIRRRLFAMKHPPNCLVKATNKWHFVDTVYRDQAGIYSKKYQPNHRQINLQVDYYNHLLVSSRFSLCPSGSGSNSIRLWESLGAGSIPIVLADELDLPALSGDLSWEKTVVRIPEKEVDHMSERIGAINSEQEREMRANCLKVYELFSGNNFARHVVESLRTESIGR